GLDQMVELDYTSQYVELTLNGALLFDSGSAELKDSASGILSQIGVILERYSGSVIEIEGHTDSVPIHSARYPSNNELSDARALSVFYYLIENTNLDPANIKHSGRGEYIPVADNTTPEGRALNRRVEIKIYNSLSSYQ
nr:flagellar motor protein MotB [Lachnospiraceae bacterium]